MRLKSALYKDFCYIGEAAALVGVSTNTLARWEERGYIRGMRDASNKRLYYKPLLKELYYYCYGKGMPGRRVGTGEYIGEYNEKKR